MSEVGEAYEGMHAESRERRAKNRQSSADLLRAHGFEFQTRNAGAHLIVDTPRGPVDFWPGTGLWCQRGTTKTHRGVFRLIGWAQEKEPRP